MQIYNMYNLLNTYWLDLVRDGRVVIFSFVLSCTVMIITIIKVHSHGVPWYWSFVISTLYFSGWLDHWIYSRWLRGRKKSEKKRCTSTLEIDKG
jgi:hypothetical protein